MSSERDASNHDSWWQRRKACKQPCYFLSVYHNTFCFVFCHLVSLSTSISPSPPSRTVPKLTFSLRLYFQLLLSSLLPLFYPLPLISSLVILRPSPSLSLPPCLSIVPFLSFSNSSSPSIRPSVRRVVCVAAFMPAESAAFLFDVLISLSYITGLGLLP